MKGLQVAIALVALAFGSFGPVDAQELRGTLAKIKKSGEIVIGHRDSALPYAYLDRQQNLVGYSIDICERLVQDLRTSLGADIKVKYIPTTAQTRIPLLANGTVDLDCGNATQTLGRARQVDFSLTTYYWNERMLAMKTSTVKSFDDLNGRVVAVIQGSTNDIYATQLINSKKADFRILRMRENSEAVLAVTTGRADVYYGDEVIFASFMQNSPDRDKLHIVGPPRSGNAIALMLRQDDSQFRLAINTTITKLTTSGELFRLIEKWFLPLGIKIDPEARAAYTLQAIAE